VEVPAWVVGVYSVKVAVVCVCGKGCGFVLFCGGSVSFIVSVPERSKGVDSSSTVFALVGSNPTADISTPTPGASSLHLVAQPATARVRTVVLPPSPMPYRFAPSFFSSPTRITGIHPPETTQGDRASRRNDPGSEEIYCSSGQFGDSCPRNLKCGVFYLQP
jgi:hypothetical protein